MTLTHLPPTGRPRQHGRLASSLLISLALAASTAATPNLQFQQDTVLASNVTTSGCAVLFSVSRESAPWMARVVPRVMPLFDIDSDGVIDYLATSGLVDKSIWAVIDTTTGTFAVNAPAPYTPEEVVIDPDKMFAVPGVLNDIRSRLELVVVRPGFAAWHGRIHDGGTGDDIPNVDGELIVSLQSLNTIWSANGKEPLLKDVEIGDIVVGIDPVSMVFYSFDITS